MKPFWNSLWVIALLAADQLTKWAIHTYLRLGEVIPLASFFDLVYFRNLGVSFGMFQAHTALGAVGLLALAAAITGWVLWTWRTAQQWYEHLGYGAIVAGALGNIIDRLRFGYVVDFLSFHVQGLYWPAFNVADSAIVGGVGLILIAQAWQCKGKSKVHL